MLLTLGLALSVAGWVQVVRRKLSGQLILPLAPYRPAPWGLLDLLVGFALLLTLPVLVLGDAPPELSEAVTAQRMLIGSLMTLLAMCLVIFFLFVKNQTTIFDLGWDGGSIATDLRIGTLSNRDLHQWCADIACQEARLAADVERDERANRRVVLISTVRCMEDLNAESSRSFVEREIKLADSAR